MIFQYSLSHEWFPKHDPGVGVDVDVLSRHFLPTRSIDPLLVCVKFTVQVNIIFLCLLSHLIGFEYIAFVFEAVGLYLPGLVTVTVTVTPAPMCLRKDL